MNNASQNHVGCDATGIAAFACARSGAFIPGSVVDFQKGERQMNIDYALCEALKTMAVGDGDKVMIIYDVMCQYHIHLWERINQNPFLSLPEKVQLLMAIGLFHVHGHQDSCLFRFATSFIPGAGMVDGEILESLWAQLNDISRSTRTSTLAHRTEVLDDHMNYSNWNKMVNIVSFVITKFNKSVIGLVDSKDYFDRLNNSALANDIEDWTKDIRKAERERERGTLEAMDIMAPLRAQNDEGMFFFYRACRLLAAGVTLRGKHMTGPLGPAGHKDADKPALGLKTTADVQLLLMEQETLSRGEAGQTSWIATGLKIEETQ